MKEYLVKDPQTGKYWATTDKDERYIVCEIPEGAIEARINLSGTINFINKDDDFANSATDWEWLGTHRGKHGVHELVWQRQPTGTLVEYLNPADWSLHVVNVDEDAAGEDWIKVPAGAECCNAGRIFYKDNGWTWYTGKEWKKAEHGYGSLPVKWQRPQQPEELPFIDDEPKTVNDTLAERQSQYGCFEDVAFVTENIISIMKKCNFDNMPHPHKMAMYMIASKMARIVNGDFNHKDSWHDIQGYAKLIENLIGGDQ